ncbi:hypothetical protein OSC52_09855 [Clostridium pasteurianum]|uniref:hypothetical protein n=1 Tax=Clostridium pasteurianum TaxID=1501 RepID=UPI001F1851D0|nr:hypothetical protein [Clostridium pasteurianum]UZW16097.1 hypothetical protein OSC52_09855 [Clostridium pasteurianum]
MKILILKEKSYINNGSSALQPERKHYGEEDKRLIQEENKRRKKLKQSKLKYQAKIMIGIALTFIVGFTIIYRYSVIYNMEKELSAATAKTNNAIKQNENLKLELMEYNQIQNIKERASHMNMVQPDKNKAVEVDYDRQTLKTDKSVENEKDKSILEILKSKIF